MELTGQSEPMIVTDSDLSRSSFSGVDCDISGLLIDGYLVSDLIAAWRKAS